MNAQVTPQATSPNYDLAKSRLRTFHDAREAFVTGADTPRAYLERCLAAIELHEPTVKAWVTLNPDAALASADASTERYRTGQALSPIDGMPVGIKDVIQTKDMPTTLGSPIFAGRNTGMDSASVNALRLAGASIVGKTVTTEFAFMVPGPTTNPYDANRTPGGSSSGSAAAVGAGMVPVALGNQVVGSVIRPAAYCANYAIKPTLGALHGGEGLSLSQLHLGVHAASLQDMWSVAYEIAHRAGADPGYPGLYGPANSAPAAQPTRLIALETEGWEMCDEVTRKGFAALLEQLQAKGTQVITRHDNPAVERFEMATRDSVVLCRILCSYEMRWALRNYQDTGLLSKELGVWLAMAENLTLDDYRQALHTREDIRTAWRALQPHADAMLTLSSPGPAPALDFLAEAGEPAYAFKTGSPSFNAATSLLGSPAITVPMMSIDGMPQGIQLIGHEHQDWPLCGFGAWFENALERVSL
ncbi:MAG: amidase [Burkholderiaceae bacterium]